MSSQPHRRFRPQVELLEARHLLSAHVLAFSKTTGFRHASIPDALAAVRQLGTQNDFEVDATEDAAAFTDANLANYQAVVFLLTTGDVLNATQQSAFERYIQAGGGFVGVHSASDTEYSWPWYGRLVGAYFQSHPPGTHNADSHFEDFYHPSTLPLLPLYNTWRRHDEWYNFRTNPRTNGVSVLAVLDESTYTGGTMGADHPITWYQYFDGGRSWYTGMGHTNQTYTEPAFRQHLLGGLLFAIGQPLFAAAFPFSSSQIGLVWTDFNFLDPALFYVLERSADGVAFDVIDVTVAPQFYFGDTGLSPNTPYYYRLWSYTTTGAVQYSNVTTARTLPGSAPGGAFDPGAVPILRNVASDEIWPGILIEAATPVSRGYPSEPAGEVTPRYPIVSAQPGDTSTVRHDDDALCREDSTSFAAVMWPCIWDGGQVIAELN